MAQPVLSSSSVSALRSDGFIVGQGRILEIDAISDPQRIRKMVAPVLSASSNSDDQTD
jgi:hypothetical protein